MTGLFPIPRPSGFFAVLIAAAALLTGGLRNEPALNLLGTLLLAVLVYSCLGVFFTGLLNRRKALALSVVIGTETVDTGKNGELYIKAGDGSDGAAIRFYRLPAVLFRCELRMETRDGRVIRHFADPAGERFSSFPVKERGAYYSDPVSTDNGSRAGCRFLIFDAPGFFMLSMPLGRNEKLRLLALPLPAPEPVLLPAKSGGTERQYEARYGKSGDLTDHRPYVSGDDPRRINWKLYGHAPLGELFVREGDPKLPRYSRLLILIDTDADRLLYNREEARLAVDLLCENALGSALALMERGSDIHIGSAGNGISGCGEENSSPNAAALTLAFPAAVSRPAPLIHDLPGASSGMGVLVFSLPRNLAGTSAPGKSDISALDNFLKNREEGQETDIVFLFERESNRASELKDAAAACTNFYNERKGIRSVHFAVSRNVQSEPVKAAFPLSTGKGKPDDSR